MAKQSHSATLSIIIVSYNTAELTRACVLSVIKEINDSKLLKNKSEIIVIDNNSSDDSTKIIQKELSQSKIKYLLIKNKKNTGFAKANNQGIEKALGKYVLLLNSDTIVHNQALEKLVKTFEKHPSSDLTATLSTEKGKLDKLGILSATLLNSNGSIQTQGGSFPNLLSVFIHMLMLDKLPIIGKFLPSTQHTGQSQHSKAYSLSNQKNNKLIQKDWVSAAAIMIKSEVFDEIGPLDQNIFMYAEDLEFCIRAKYHHWDIAIDPQAKITHLGSASSSSENALIGEFKGLIYIWSKHKAKWQMPLLKALLQLGAMIRIIIFDTISLDKKKMKIYQKVLTVIDE